jgi:hypothetical protein
MWIRSQDKCNLINAIDIYAGNCSVYGITASEGSDSYTVLGRYNTEVRALEVMDEITMAIVCNVSVYEMPKE